MSLVSDGSGGRKSLRPYQHPPYKHTASFYERRMRELRNTMQERAIKMTTRLRALDPSDPALVAMCHEMTVHGNASKFRWIERATNELKLLSAEMEPGITKERAESVVLIRENMTNALADWDQHKDAHQHVVEKPSTLPEEESYEDEEGRHKGPPPPTEEQMEHANIVKNSLADLIDSLSKPFWPRPVPTAVKGVSPYGQGDPKSSNPTPAPDKSRPATRNAKTPAHTRPKRGGSSQPAEKAPAAEKPPTPAKKPSAVVEKAPAAEKPLAPTEKPSAVAEKDPHVDPEPVEVPPSEKSEPSAANQVDVKSDEALTP